MFFKVPVSLLILFMFFLPNDPSRVRHADGRTTSSNNLILLRRAPARGICILARTALDHAKGKQRCRQA